MTIAQIRTVAIDQALTDPEWRFAQGPLTRIQGFAVVLTSGEGLSGHGYVRAMPPWTEPLAAMRASFDHLAEALPGQDETAIGEIMDGLDRRLHGVPTVKGGIECALYDLRARALGVPLHDLYGGKRQDSFANTRIIPLKSAAQMAEVAETLVAAGFRHLKVKVSGEPALDIDRVRAVRAAVGPEIRLMIDANESYTPKLAVSTINAMARFGLDLAEQPTAAADFRSFIAVARALDVPVEADESAQDLPSILRIAEAGTVESINLRLLNLGGPTKTREAVAICRAAGMGFRFGAVFGSSIVHAHTVHLAASLPHPRFPHEFSEMALLTGDRFSGIAVEGGRVAVPAGAGTGLVLEG
ncbi:mandelate racemase/muconate lactonizing enzyme family protein [Bosea sp. (in: a-proteobacteria)]|uniref:mandelate racemase/muconate lactonizing enzyme family protein n=1 Tax=Bosea sp. (in: a-proteobacteria) TaxID=1871050 RepID=UPI002FC8D0AD